MINDVGLNRTINCHLQWSLSKLWFLCCFGFFYCSKNQNSIQMSNLELILRTFLNFIFKRWFFYDLIFQSCFLLNFSIKPLYNQKIVIFYKLIFEWPIQSIAHRDYWIVFWAFWCDYWAKFRTNVNNFLDFVFGEIINLYSLEIFLDLELY